MTVVFVDIKEIALWDTLKECVESQIAETEGAWKDIQSLVETFFWRISVVLGKTASMIIIFSCEGCANLKNLMDIEIDKSKEATKYDKLISKIKNELSEAKKEI